MVTCMLSSFTVPDRRIGRGGGASGLVGPGRSGWNVPAAVNAPLLSVSIAPGTVALPQSNSMSVPEAATVIAMCCPPHGPDFTAVSTGAGAVAVAQPGVA